LRHLVVGTAGHIDHGKSALVRALTGIDPDRLREEKERGITIDLGFADLALDGGRIVSFVDVPGHERFVRHMVAGATGVDAVLLVVAADQGVQPQTREHLAICSLLAVRAGVLALSKCDLVDPELCEVASLELREAVAGTFLAAAPLIPVSARTGAGLADLVAALARLFADVPPRPDDGVVRLPVDRSFVLRGFGTVVTGTLVSGRLAEGDEVEVLPGGRRARVRGLQTHGTRLPLAVAGQRTAANLQGLERGDVPRGSTLTTPGALAPTRRAWARVALLPEAERALVRGGPVRFHHGTAERAARLRVVGTFGPGDVAAELRFAEDTVLAPGDRFILRRPRPVDTAGGGTVVDAHPPHERRPGLEPFQAAALDPERALGLRLQRAALAGVEAATLCRELGWSAEQLRGHLAPLAGTRRAVNGGPRWFDGWAWDDLARRAAQATRAFHAASPLQPGISRETLRQALAPRMPQESWRAMLAALVAEGHLRAEGELVCDPGHRVLLEGADEELARRISAAFRQAGLDPPALEAVLAAEDPARAGPIVEWLVARGELVRIQDRRLFHAEALEALRSRLREHARRSRTIDVGTFKQLAGVTRKNAIPLLEQLDAERSTRRVGDGREILL